MLVLTRRLHETVMIGDDVSITIIEVRGNQVVVGIAASPAVKVDRLEIYNAKRRQRGLPELSREEAREIGTPRTTLTCKKQPA